MKLSEAIRLGSLITRQGWGPHSFSSLDAPCALGTALRAVARQSLNYSGVRSYNTVREIWPWTNTAQTCPLLPYCYHNKETWAGEIIYHLNDQHRWSRECIADWVETREPENVQDSSTFTDHEHTTNAERTRA